jgi:hypothetical protein
VCARKPGSGNLLRTSTSSKSFKKKVAIKNHKYKDRERILGWKPEYSGVRAAESVSMHRTREDNFQPVMHC